MHLAYACEWWRPREPTWSYVAERLLDALRRQPIRVSEVPVQRPAPLAALLATMYLPVDGMPWKYSAVNRWLIDRAVTRKSNRSGADAVVELADIVTPTRVPTFCYQDMNFDVALAYRDEVGSDMVTTLPVSKLNLDRLADRQRERYGHIDGVLSWSRWFAEWLCARHQIDSARVHVVGAGMNHVPSRARPLDTGRPRTRLLFVGGDFMRKGGDLVVQAVEQLRKGGFGPLTLTVIGRGPWPMPSEPPVWVDYVGGMTGAPVADVYASHDLFVMPSRFEAYGIAVLEAQAAGLPVVTRRAFALPELVEDGRTGLLVDHADPGLIAEAIAAALVDDDLYVSVAAAAPEIARRHSWDAVAGRVLAAVSQQAVTRDPAE